ncbi:MAG: hypothetical protein LKE40_05320 [Spirochaetia bacterium]|jgi:lipopolysaccharide export system protein LptA|nr:hypothetical protein [Spirochaetia bacterium]
MKNKLLVSAILLSMCIMRLFAEPISFSGGYTQLKMQQDHQVIQLKEGAHVTIGSLSIDADTIEISGKDYALLTCSGTVLVKDSDKGLTIRCNEISYDRSSQIIRVNSFIELDDTSDALHATASGLSYNRGSGKIDLQVAVKLYHDADGKLMKCNADYLSFDTEQNNLALLGNAKVTYAKDIYDAQAISVDLKDNRITMDGSIRGTVND